MLSTKQKAYLKSLAQSERAIFQIGKDGFSDAQIEQINNALKARELVKISILKNAPSDDLKELAFDLARLTKSELIQLIGRTVVLYKKGKDAKILLP